jgi:hypothetical protein
VVWTALGSEQLDSRPFLDTYRTALGRLQTACGSGYLEGVYTSRRFGANAEQPDREVTVDIAYGSDGDREKHGLIRRDLAFPPYFERVFLPRSGRTLILERIDPSRPCYIRLKVDTPVLYFDRPAPKTSVELSFQLTNSRHTPVRVVGMRIGCAATLPADDLPCRMEPGQTRRFALTLRAFSEPETGEAESPLYLYTTAPGQAEVELTLVGRRNTENR